MKRAKSVSNEYFSTEHLRSDLKKRAVRGAGATVISQVTCQTIQMLSIFVLARLLTPDDFGLFAMVVSIFLFFKMFRSGGLLDATIQKEEINHKQISTLFWINLAFGLGMTLIFIAFSPLIAWFYNDSRLKTIAVIISLDFVLAGFSAQHRALIKRNFQFYKTAALEICGTTISYMIAILLAWNGWGYWALVVRYVTYPVIEALCAWTFCRWRPGLPGLGTGVRPMLKFGINMLGNFSVNYFTDNLDKILIGWRYGTESLGYYSRAYHLFLAPAQQLAYPMTGVAVATLSRLCQEPEKYRKYFLNAFSTLAFIGFPMSAMLTVFGKDFILILLGPQWGKAAEIFSVLGFGVGMQVLYGTHQWLHISLGRTDRWLRWNITATLITILSYFIGLQFGVIGVAVAYTIALNCLIFPALWYAGRPIGLGLFALVLSIWRYFVAATMAGLLCWFILYSFTVTAKIFISLNIFVRLVLSCSLCMSIYLIITIVLFQNVKPIAQFVSVLKDLLPRSIKNG